MSSSTESPIILISKTIHAFYDPSEINSVFLRNRITHISREIFKSFAYALTCWYWIPLCEYAFSLTISPAIAWIAFVVHLAFYFRFIIVSLFTLEIAFETYQNIKDPAHGITYHCNVSENDHPLLHHFWFNCGCDPNQLTEEERTELTDLIEEKGFSIPKWDIRPYMDSRKSPKKFSRQAFNDFQKIIQKYHVIDLYYDHKVLERDDLLDLLDILSTGTKILFSKTVSMESSPLYDVASKVKTFFNETEISQHQKFCYPLLMFLKENDWSADPTVTENPFFLYRLHKLHPLIKHLKDRGLKCSLFDEALELCDKPLPPLPSGLSLCLHFKTKEREKVYETALKTASLKEKWYWHADMVFWENEVKTDQYKRVGLVSTGYLSDNQLRPKHWNTAEFYRVTLPPGIDPSLQKKAEEVFYTRISEMAKTKSKWKTLELRNTFLFKRDQADFSFFPFLELYLLASITFFHKTIRRYWNPETFDVTISRKLWCSEFNFFLIIDALQQVNQFLETKGHSNLPYPVDGYENTAGITPHRLKELLMNHGMLVEQFKDKTFDKPST